MLSSNVPASLPSPQPPQPSPVFSKWSLESGERTFVDEVAECMQKASIPDEDPSNTVKLRAYSAQVEAYSPGEDKIYVNEKDNLFAVFDGHGGDICSRYVVDKLPKMLLSSLQVRKPVSDNEYASMFKSVFVQTDDQFLNAHKHIVKTCPTGSCGVTVLVRNDKLYVSNLGDSRVLLGSKSQNWSHTLLTNDHNTKNEKERQMVKQRTTDPFPIRGHMLQNVPGERVGGILMVTRAFGDGIFKRKEMSLNPLIKHLPYITNEPEVTVHTLAPTDSYAIISSDGLYEYLKPEDVAKIVEQHLENGLDPSKLGALLIEKQYEAIGKLVGKTAEQVKRVPNCKTFMDDTSIVVLIFRHPEKKVLSYSGSTNMMESESGGATL